jgi:hypothetical protein
MPYFSSIESEDVPTITISVPSIGQFGDLCKTKVSGLITVPIV